MQNIFWRGWRVEFLLLCGAMLCIGLALLYLPSALALLVTVGVIGFYFGQRKMLKKLIKPNKQPRKSL